MAARISASVRDAAGLDGLVGQVAAGQQVAALVEELQGERVLAQAYVGAGRPPDRATLDAGIGRVDAAAAAVTTLPPDRFGPRRPTSPPRPASGWPRLPALRRAVRESAMPAERVGATYTSIIEVQLALERAALRAAPAPLLRAATDAGTVAAAKEQVRRQQATLAAVLVGGSATPSSRRPRGRRPRSSTRRSPSSVRRRSRPPGTGTTGRSWAPTWTTAGASSSGRSPR